MISYSAWKKKITLLEGMESSLRHINGVLNFIHLLFFFLTLLKIVYIILEFYLGTKKTTRSQEFTPNHINILCLFVCFKLGGLTDE